MSSVTSLLAYQQALAEVSKNVEIQIGLDDLTTLKKAGYRLCFAKKVGDNAYNVVWQSYDLYLHINEFSWVPMYQLFGTNRFEDDVTVQATTNTVDIGLGEMSVLNAEGILEPPITGGPQISITMDNMYGPIHPGINQLSTGLDGSTVSTPIYVSEHQVVPGEIVLTPVEKVLVWFEQNIQTSTMFSDARSNSVEIDLTTTNSATRLYAKGVWSTPG